MLSLFMASTITLLLISLWINYKTLKTMAITLHFLIEFATSVDEELSDGETQRLH